MATLLLAEHDNASLKEATAKALTAAKALGAEVDVLVAGEGCKAAAESGAKLDGVRKVLIADAPLYGHQLAEPLAALLVSLAKDYDALVAPATTSGKNVMPRVAALLDVMQISDILKVESPDTFERPIYAAMRSRPCARPMPKRSSLCGLQHSRRRARADRRRSSLLLQPTIPPFRPLSARNCRNSSGRN
jgi:electron transfer flavoprotein alpha subunit